MKLFVLHPGSPFSEQHFSDFAGTPLPKSHPPLFTHGFAACTGGAFVRNASSIPDSEKRVLLLLDENLKRARQSIIDLRRNGKIVILGFFGNRSSDLLRVVQSPGYLEIFQDICSRAHAAITTAKDLEPVFRSCGLLYVEHLHPPIPCEEAEWNFSISPDLQRGIFLGSWNWKTSSKKHLLALLGLKEVVSQMYEPVTVFNLDGWRGRRWLRQLKYPAGLLQIVETRVPYPEYLKIVAKHKLVFHLEADDGWSKAATDAFLCRIPCIGGTGTIEKSLFPELNGSSMSVPDLLQTASRLLDHAYEREQIIERAQEIAKQLLSFQKTQQTIEELFHYLG